jgi:hypothetical protein
MKKPPFDLAKNESGVDRRLFLAASGVAMAGTLVSGAGAMVARDELTWMPAWKIRDAIVAGKYTALEVTDHFLARIAKLDPILHAFLKLDAEGAKEQAKAADAALKSGAKPRTLHGVPVVCSDIPAHREVAISATFFSLDESLVLIAEKIRENAAVQARQERRGVMRRLSWERIVRERLEPLLLGASTP